MRIYAVIDKSIVMGYNVLNKLYGVTIMKARWLFFDIGSTLADESVCYQKRYEEMTQNSHITKDELVAKVIEYAAKSSNACHLAAEFYHLTIPKWHHELECLYPDAEKVLNELSKKYQIGIIANQSLGSEERLNAWGVGQYIDLVVASAEVGISKPDLNIFKLALQKAGCKPDEAFMIGDRLDNDIIPAKTIGMNTIWIKQGFAAYKSIANSNETPDFVINSLSELLFVLE